MRHPGVPSRALLGRAIVVPSINDFLKDG